VAQSTIAGFEGRIANAKWDVNHFRVGYGSDTTTDPVTGQVSEVTSGTTGVSKEAADADLKRRVTTQYMPQAAQAIGVDKWNKLSPNAQAAITSVTYNYGHVPPSVVTAAQSGDAKQIGSAIEGLRGANEGINASRRDQEAQLAMAPGAPAVPGIAGAPPTAGVAAGTGTAAGVGGGTGTAPETKLTGGADLNIKLAGFPQGTSTSASTSGNIFAAPPRVELAMSTGAGP
jgi:GH24 family phage-related lysozyme (muramidase)